MDRSLRTSSPERNKPKRRGVSHSDFNKPEKNNKTDRRRLAFGDGDFPNMSQSVRLSHGRGGKARRPGTRRQREVGSCNNQMCRRPAGRPGRPQIRPRDHVHAAVLPHVCEPPRLPNANGNLGLNQNFAKSSIHSFYSLFFSHKNELYCAQQRCDDLFPPTSFV